MKKCMMCGIIAIAVVLSFTAVVSAELYKRAPETLPGTLPEMREVSYWVDKMDSPDEIVMTPAAIQRMNDNFQKFLRLPEPFKGMSEDRMPKLSSWWPGYVLYVPDLQSLSPAAVADTVKSRINSGLTHMRKQPYGNLNAIEYSPRQIDAFEAEMNLDGVGRSVEILDVIAVRTARLRNVPTFSPDQVGIMQIAKTRWDLWNVGILKIGMPAKVLHRSKSGEYAFVLCEVGYGWVRTSEIAFSYKAKIDEFVNADDFVVCTGGRVPFYSDSSCAYASGYFRMGDRLPMAEKSDWRKVLAPVRKMNGEFTTETVWLAKDADVSIGLLPYTRKNIVTTAFKLLDDQFDWTGAWFGRSHETTFRDIFACFGFSLPYHGGLFTFFNDNKPGVVKADAELEERYKASLANDPFYTLQICSNHPQLYIGDLDGVPILFDQHGYGYEDDEGNYFEVRRCNIGDQRMPSYFLKNKIMFLELK